MGTHIWPSKRCDTRLYRDSRWCKDNSPSWTLLFEYHRDFQRVYRSGCFYSDRFRKHHRMPLHRKRNRNRYIILSCLLSLLPIHNLLPNPNQQPSPFSYEIILRNKQDHMEVTINSFHSIGYTTTFHAQTEVKITLYNIINSTTWFLLCSIAEYFYELCSILTSP